MPKINYNERSWAIDLISDINLWLNPRDLLIKRAGGENTLKSGKKSLFPDVLLFGDANKGRILQGWELKMPDTPLNDDEFIKNAKLKAKILSLNSFLLWNVSTAVLYKIEDDDSLTVIKNWNNLSHIKKRDEVLQNKKEILVMLEEILNDVNDFILNGDIKSVSVDTVLNNEAIDNLVQRNLGGYVKVLEENAKKDSNFLDDITLWWRYAKNDYPEEDNKFVVLARNNLLFLVNKFLFAHILKSYHSDAEIVNEIDDNSSIIFALNAFESISKKCDFWNIFQKQKGEEILTLDIWQDVLSFNALLKEFNFSKIDRGLLHDLISLTVYRNKRKFAGQFTTPLELAKFISKLTIRDAKLHSIDPCCGTGTIAREIYNLKKEASNSEQALETIWASDKFSLPLQMAMFNLADPEALGCLIKVFKKDASELIVGQDIKMREPFKGNLIIKKLPKFGYIISNLPFVQQKDVKVLNPDIEKINNFISEKLGKEYTLDGRSDLYAYLPFYLWNILDDNGKMSIIVSNSWMGTNWGEIFYNALSGFFHIESIIISGSGRWFDNAKVVTNIISLRKKSNPVINNVKNDSLVKFITTKNILKKYKDEEIEEIVALISSKEQVDEEDILINSCADTDIKEVLELGLNLNSFFANNNWILKLKDKLVRISDFFIIGRGERRGWDKMFYPVNSDEIENDYLKPVLKTPRTIDNLIAKPDALAFCCDKTKNELIKLGHLGAFRWIEKFEGQTNGDGIPLTTSLARAKMNWYTMSPSTMADIVTSINFGDRLFFARFEEPTFVNQRLVRFTPKTSEIDIELCHALMNSILGLYYIEAMGTGRGEGALDLSKDKIENSFHIINPSLIGSKDREEILSIFKKIEKRKILPIKEELKQKDRIDFDNKVLESIGCLKYKIDIEKALVNLYEIRNSVKND